MTKQKPNHYTPLFEASPEELAFAKARILRLCDRFGWCGVSKSNIFFNRAKFRLSNEDRNRLLAQMVADGELVEVRDFFVSQTRRTTRYFLPGSLLPNYEDNAA